MTVRQRRVRTVVQVLFLLFLVVGCLYIALRQRLAPYRHSSGGTFGTLYNITYQSDHDLEAGLMRCLNDVDASLSMYNDSSVLARINRNEGVEPDAMFLKVFDVAMQVWQQTGGAFDITVAPLVHAWGFGSQSGALPDSAVVDSLLRFVGSDKVRLDTSRGRKRIVKADDRVMLDCSAIAKGYACDVVARWLEAQDVSNYMIEIGGEIVCRGVNAQRSPWRIGLTTPEDDSLNISNDIMTVVEFNDIAMATSGNYRKFYVRDGKKYAHTIDPKSGRPVEHTLLSATVFARECVVADAFATAFMVVGTEKAQHMLAEHPELTAYLVYSDDDGEMRTWCSPTLKEHVKE